jgi:hypothetical protein
MAALGEVFVSTSLVRKIAQSFHMLFHKSLGSLIHEHRCMKLKKYTVLSNFRNSPPLPV